MFGADGGPGGGLSFAGSDAFVEVAVTAQIADTRDALDTPRTPQEHGSTAKHPVAPQNLFDLGPSWATATCIQQQSFDHQWECRFVKKISAVLDFINNIVRNLNCISIQVNKRK